MTSPRLSERYHGHDNNFDIIRFFAACLVVLGHAYTLAHATPADPQAYDPISSFLWVWLPFETGMHGQGVNIFFFVSGFLVCRSYMQGRGLSAFLRARALRIFPALWVNLLFCVLVVGLLATTLPVAEYLASGQTHRYLYLNASLLAVQYELPGVFASLPYAGSVNGSLWTLPLEVRLYGWCLLLGIAGLLKRRGLFLAVFALLLAVETATGWHLVLSHPYAHHLWWFFFLGMSAFLFAERIPLSPAWLALSLAALPLLHLLPLPVYHHLSAVVLGYAVLFLAYWRYAPRLDIGRIGDFSYGIYLYSYPVQQALIWWLGPALGWGWMILLSFAVTLPLAAASWFLIEKPALAWKKKRPAPIPKAA